MSKRQREYQNQEPIPKKQALPEYHQCCDSQGILKWRSIDSIGEMLQETEPLRRRYKLLDELGRGGWATVLHSWDRIYDRYVAIKVATVESSEEEYARIEIEMLDLIKKGKRDSNMTVTHNCCLELDSWFTFKGLVCMVFSRYGDDLFTALKKSMWKPMPMQTIQEIGYQLFSTLVFLRKLKLVHTDIKLENILFEHTEDQLPNEGSRAGIRNSSRIKLIDFGNAVCHDSPHPSLITTRPYRAPEVILNTGWTYDADVWSVGCVLIELFLGKPLFVATEDPVADETVKDIEQLAVIEKTIGPFPLGLITVQDAKGYRHPRNLTISNYFSPESWTISTKGIDSAALQTLRSAKPLNELVDSKMHPHFSDLIHKIFSFGNDRISSSDAITHSFFSPIRSAFAGCCHPYHGPYIGNQK